MPKKSYRLTSALLTNSHPTTFIHGQLDPIVHYNQIAVKKNRSAKSAATFKKNRSK